MILQYIKYHKRSSISEQVGSALYYVYAYALYIWDKHGHISAVHTTPAPFVGHALMHPLTHSQI